MQWSLHIAAPLATQMLGDMGAEVIKVEDPVNGDGMRAWELTKCASEFQAYNRGEKGLPVDLRQPLGREGMARHFGSGVAGRLGFGYVQVYALNPRIIHYSISGFGQSEWASRLDAADVPNEAVLHVKEALASPKVPPLKPYVEAELAIYGPVRTVAPGAGLSETPIRRNMPPPGLGEHTVDILAECGWNAASITRLAEAGVVRTVAPE